jgi:hypothetical protein
MRLGQALESVAVLPRGITTLVEPLKTDDAASIEIVGLILLAGEASQRRFAPWSVRKRHIEADRSALARIVDKGDVPRLRRKAKEMVRESWPEIKAMARELLKKGRIEF